MLGDVGAVQQLHRFAVVSSQVLKVALEEERGRGLTGEETGSAGQRATDTLLTLTPKTLARFTDWASANP